MDDNKMLEYAKNLRSDLKYHLENNEEQNICDRDIKTIEWLIEQAKRAEMYKLTLMHIGARHEPSSRLANVTLFEADQRFNAHPEKEVQTEEVQQRRFWF